MDVDDLPVLSWTVCADYFKSVCSLSVVAIKAKSRLLA